MIPEHTALVRRGADAVAQALASDPSLVLVLIDADLKGLDLEGIDLSRARLQRANLSGCNLVGATFSGADLTDAQFYNSQLSGAVLDECACAGAKFTNASLVKASAKGAVFSNGTHFHQADLREIDLDRAKINGANIADAASLSKARLTNIDFMEANLSKIIADGADFSGSILGEATLDGGYLDEAVFRGVNLVDAKFGSATCTSANFTDCELALASFENANCEGAKFNEARLYRTNFEGASLTEASFERTNFDETRLTGSSWKHATGLESSRGLQTTRIKMSEDVQYFDEIKRSPLAHIDWEFLRVFGNLPLFGISYASLVAIPVSLYLLDIYNANVIALRHWLILALPAEKAATVMTTLKVVAIPQQFGCLFISTCMLAVASTLYAIFCPARIKNFSSQQWRYELGHSIAHYWPESWRWVGVRILCVMLYCFGGGLAMYVILTKLYGVAKALWH